MSKLSVLLLAFSVFQSCPTMALAKRQPREALESAWIEPHIGNALPLTAEFIDHTGSRMALGEIVGQRTVVLCLVYFECPMLCKLAADGLVRTAASLPQSVGQEFDIVFVSFDPRDTSDRASDAREQTLRRYARPGTELGWHFLTGPQESIDQLTDAVGFHYLWDADTKQFSHATGIMVVSPSGTICEYLDGVNISPKELITAIQRATKSELTESTAAVFMRCYLYDPTNGKFGSIVQWTIRVLGIATVVGIATLVIRLGRHSATNAFRSE